MEGQIHGDTGTRVRLYFQFAGIAPDATSRQDRLSGVIICPALREGTAVNREVQPTPLRGELHHRYHCIYYTGRMFQCQVPASQQSIPCRPILCIYR